MHVPRETSTPGALIEFTKRLLLAWLKGTSPIIYMYIYFYMSTNIAHACMHILGIIARQAFGRTFQMSI